jgi:hypothetical protein
MYASLLKVKNCYMNLVRRQHNFGDRALALLKSYRASCTIVDFINLRIIAGNIFAENETNGSLFHRSQ